MRVMKFRFFRSNIGSMTIEFAIVIVLFIFTLLFCSEIARLFYISASLDLAVSEAAKSAKNKEQSDSKDYQTLFHETLIQQQGVLGTFITANNTVIANVIFSNSISDIINNNTNTINRNEALASYSVSYTYKPIFFPIPSLWTNNILFREVIFVQEN